MEGNRFGRVVGVHPESYAVDLLMLEDGARLASVQVLSPFSGTDFGEMGMVAPDIPDPSDKFALPESKTRDIYAIVSYAGRVPFVMGFLFPQVCQMLFKDVNRRINRHSSDVYTNLKDNADFEFYHPSGTFFRIATDAAHEDLTGQDFDKKWKIQKNTTSTPRVHLEVWNGGVQKATVDLDKDGNIALTNTGTLTSSSGGDITVQTTSANAILKAATTVKLDAPNVHMTGDAQVDGTLTATTDVIGGGKHLKTHTHGGVAAGTAHTAAPD